MSKRTRNQTVNDPSFCCQIMTVSKLCVAGFEIFRFVNFITFRNKQCIAPTQAFLQEQITWNTG